MASTSKKETAAPAASGLPMFFVQPSVIDKARHASAGVSTKLDLSFARGTNSVPLNAIEFLEAAKHFPIVFTTDEQPLPVAVLGFEQDNYFITDKNHWRAHSYVPAYIRQYPFIFYQPENDERFFLCIDEGSSMYEANAGGDAMPLFVEGEPSDTSKRALEFCSAFAQHLAITNNLCADLKKHNLLAPYHTQAKVNGKELQLNGFTIIDEKAFNALPEETFLEFRKKGWLAFIYLALASGTNWKHLVELAQERN